MLEEQHTIPEKPLAQEVNITTPGAMLLAARQARGMEVSEVAAKLKLSQHWIEGIETDDYHRMGARVYLRGYLRSYAQLLGVNVDAVLKAFDHIYKANEEPAEKPVAIQQPLVEHVRSPKNVRRIIRWGALALGAVIVLLVIVWWHDQRTAASASQVSLPAQTQNQSADDQSVVLASPVQTATKTPTPAATTTKATPATSKPTAAAKPAKQTALTANYTVSKITH